MIKLTAPDGSPVWIAKSWVQMVLSPSSWGEAATGAKAKIVLSGQSQYVQEDVTAVVLALEDK